ncbi:MAG: cation:proton antiporter [Clostridiales bacterium]|nr:cation:proton antiporter [Clostridiales bacterium]
MAMLSTINTSSPVPIWLAVILFAGFTFTRITKALRLPNVSGFMLAGIIIGPCCLKLVPKELIGNMDFVSDIALCLIAFGAGRYFTSKGNVKAGKAFFVTAFESLFAGALVFAAMHFLFKLSLSLSLILGSIAMATSPAGIMMTIRQYKAKGSMVDMLMRVIAFDAMLCIPIFSAALAYHSGGSLSSMLLPIILNILSAAFGVLCAFVLHFLLKRPSRSSDNRLILTVAMLLTLCGVCGLLSVSPLIASILFGAVYKKISGDEKIFEQVDAFSPPVMSIFFILSGMNLDIQALMSAGLIGLAYALIRFIGKYIGAFVSLHAIKSDASVKKNLGIALTPQAGVSIGLAFLAKRVIPESDADTLMAIVLFAGVLYELTGPTLAKFALKRAGAFDGANKVDAEPKE